MGGLLQDSVAGAQRVERRRLGGAGLAALGEALLALLAQQLVLLLLVQAAEARGELAAAVGVHLALFDLRRASVKRQ
jgi:hypothetical protein